MDAPAPETIARLGAFLGGLGILLWAELRWPGWAARMAMPWRRAKNLALGTLNVAAVAVLMPALGVAAALWAQHQGWGIFHVLDAPLWIALPLGVMALDLAIYGQHRLFHANAFLWRLHRVHHADRGMDATTGLRFHPLEALFSTAYRALVIVALGIGPWTVIVFEILLNLASMFEHANLRLSSRMDAALRRVIVTPAMHRVHHTTHQDEQRSNYGFFLSFWDRLFRSYRAGAREGADPVLGLNANDPSMTLGAMLADPFTNRDRAPQASSNVASISSDPLGPAP